jgi:predicted transcriptional regulator
MPAAIDATKRADIIYYSALGYTQQEISDVVGVSRNTIRKYRRAAREAVEDADDPRQTLVEILLGEYDWDRPGEPVLSFGDHPM